MEQSFKLVQQLVSNFKANESAYLASNYSESQVRSDFIDKFFTALGWDVTHTKQFNPYEQEVKIENKVTMPGTQRRADYAFFIMPNYRDVKFFTEAKKPSRNLSNADDYYQAIRYAWNANTPIAILTDFEEFHILDCRYKPDIKNSLNRKIKQYHYSHYADEEKFKEIFYLFGREAVANGSLEKFAADLPKPHGKAIRGGLFKGGYKSVDEAFLEQLDEYRNTLAKAFKKENQELGGEELTEAVQRTIDRLVFIRFLEDKGIEEPQIIGLHENKSAWNSFLAICKRFEPKYNGLIFKPHRILDGNTFNPPDDRDFANICGELSDPTSPYDFDKIPISILGSIYERFLGKVVHATAKRVEVQEKPEVRKAGGVYYTPEYIVRYIVNETVGKLLYHTPSEPTQKTTSFPNDPIGNLSMDSRQEHAGMTNMDASTPSPKAPSLSMTDTKKESHPEQASEVPKGQTSASKGVRIGKTPDEIAKMSFADIACGSGSFLIEVYSVLLEYHDRWYNANKEKAKKEDVFERDGHLHLSLKKKKEILTNNVYGVDIDFQATEVTQLSLYLKLLENVSMNETYQMGMFKETILPNLNNNIVCGNSLIGTDFVGLFESEETDKLKAMNYEDVFPQIMKRGGFDAIVGNPPYGRDILSNYKSYFSEKYLTSEYKLDSFVFFIERSVRNILKGGILGYIVPNTWLNTDTFLKLRDFLLTKTKIISIVNLGKDVFNNANIDTLIVIVSLEKSDTITVIDASNHSVGNERLLYINRQFFAKQNDWLHNSSRKFNIYNNTDEQNIFDKMVSSSVLLGKISEISQGLIPYNTKEASEKNLYISDKKNGSEWKKLLDKGGCISRYELRWNNLFVKFGPWLYTANQSKFYENEKLLIQRHRNPSLKRRVIATYDNNNYYYKDNLCGIIIPQKYPYNIKYILGLVNSELINEYYRKNHTEVSLNPVYLRKIPIHEINFSNSSDKACHDNIVKLVEQMLEAKQKITTAKTDGEVNRLELLCASLDRKIDEAVYELYGLTEEEIKIVEE